MVVFISLLIATPKNKIIPELLFKVSVREIHNSMVSRPEVDGLKEARDEENNIIISDSTLRNILPPQLKNMTYQYNVMCGCECCISVKIMHSSLLLWHEQFFKF